MRVELNKLAKRLGEPIVHTGQKHGFSYIVTPSSAWLLKPVRDLKRALWWKQTDRRIRERGFQAMPGFFIWQDEWAVMHYIAGRTAQYRHIWDLQQAVTLLARFHVAANRMPNYALTSTRSTLPERLAGRYEQYKLLHDQLSSAYPELLPMSKEFLRLGEIALKRIDDTALVRLTQKDVAQGSIAHRDLASHNILIGYYETPWLIDFETAGADIQLGDLWQICSRALVEWHWDPYIYGFILRTYQMIRPLNEEERSTLSTLFLFPNDFYREALGLLKRRRGFSEHKVIPYLQMIFRDRKRWLAFLQHVGTAW